MVKAGKVKLLLRKCQPLCGDGVEVTYAAKCIWIRQGRSSGCQDYGLVRAHAGALVHRMRVATLEHHVALGAYHEEGRRERERMKALEIDVTAIHHVEGSGLDQYLVEDVDIMHFAIGNMDERGDVAMQVEQRVHLYRAFALAESGPRKQCEAQIDGGRIERVQALIEVYADCIGGVERTRDVDQDMREVGEDAPVAQLVSVGQSGTGNLATKAHMVSLGSQRAKAGLYIAQALAIRQLRKGHGQILIPAGKAARACVALITCHATAKLAVGKKRNQLLKDGVPVVHAPSSNTGAHASNRSAQFKSRQEKSHLKQSPCKHLQATQAI
jgi:hypothetical protein